jgi:TolB-like protein
MKDSDNQPAIEAGKLTPVREKLLRDELARLMESSPFKESGRMRQLLAFIFEKTLEGEGESMTQYVIAAECFNLGEGFIAEDNTLVRSHARRLRRALKAFYQRCPTLTVRFELPPGQYGLRFIEEKAATEETVLETELPILALVEFKAMALDEDWGAFPSVLAEELCYSLGSAEELRVLGPLSRARVGEDSLRLLELAREHGARLLLDGSIEQKKSSFVVRVRLIDVQSGLQVWTTKETVNLKTPDISHLESVLMGRLSVQLGAEYGVVNSQLSQLALVKPRERLSVYEAVLLGRRLVTQLDIRRADFIIDALRANIEQYPVEPLTRSVLASALLVSYSDPQWRHGLLLDEIFEHTQKAIELAPNRPWTLTAEGFSAVAHKDRDRLHELGQRVRTFEGGSQMLRGSLALWMILQYVDLPTAHTLMDEAIAANPHFPPAFHLANMLSAFDQGHAAEVEACLKYMPRQPDYKRFKTDTHPAQWHWKACPVGAWGDPIMRASMAGLQKQGDQAAFYLKYFGATFRGNMDAAASRLGAFWHEHYIERIEEYLGHVGLDLSQGCFDALYR